MAIRTKTQNSEAASETNDYATSATQHKAGTSSSFLLFGLVASLLMLGSSYFTENNETKTEAATCQAKLESTYQAIDKLRNFSSR